MGMRMPETCWAVFKRQVIKLRSCCILLVDSVESMMMHGLVNPKSPEYLPSLLSSIYPLYSAAQQTEAVFEDVWWQEVLLRWFFISTLDGHGWPPWGSKHFTLCTHWTWDYVDSVGPLCWNETSLASTVHRTPYRPAHCLHTKLYRLSNTC